MGPQFIPVKKVLFSPARYSGGTLHPAPEVPGAEEANVPDQPGNHNTTHQLCNVHKTAKGLTSTYMELAE